VGREKGGEKRSGKSVQKKGGGCVEHSRAAWRGKTDDEEKNPSTLETTRKGGEKKGGVPHLPCDMW